jgi:hypothetical protein
MVMPLCGTFHYAGVVPDTRADRESGKWRLDDQSGAAPRTDWRFWQRNELFDNRLVGLRPALRILRGQLMLEAVGWRRAQVRSAALELDESLLAIFQGGDVLTLVRTSTADIGVSLLRDDRLIVALGAATEIPLGENVEARNGFAVDNSTFAPEQLRREDTWVDVSVSGEACRLRRGEETTICNYRISALRCFEEGIPGTHESLAISLNEICPHEAAVHSAELLARPNAGLIMACWQ